VKRGFKSECESLAAAVRSEIGLDTRAPLDSRLLAEYLGIPLHPVSSLRGDGVAAAIRHVMVVNQSVLSAMTIFPQWPRRRRVIIFNDGNSDARQNSDVAHELSHGILLHEPRTAILNGCRDYAKEEENEAAWLSGCLLVPRDAAVVVAMSGTPLHVAAEEYGVSTQMMTFRVNSTGARRQAEASRARRGRSA
jgi:Zn-dependent peptidase ImmA (M78 family)